MSKTDFAILASALALALCGCRMDRMTIREPVSDRVIEVESGDRFYVELEENTTTGYRWEASCDDDRNLVDVFVKHISPETQAPSPEPRDPRPLLCGAPGKAEVSIRVHRGFVGPATVEMKYARAHERERPIRHVKFVLWRRDGDVAPWKD